MIAYLLEGATATNAKEDKRARRLLSAGPWMAQDANGGALLSWLTDNRVARPMSAYGTPRKTLDGLMYYPPKELPRPEDLVRPSMFGRDDLHKIEVALDDTVVTLLILPAYASPRSILDNNNFGEFVASYTKKTRALLARMTANPKMEYQEYAVDLWDCCRHAIMHTTRATPELISDCGWLNEESAWPIWRAILDVPKDSSLPEGAASESSSPAPVASKE